ncbi:MAG: hypothetical protein AAGI03_01440 [Pseudomonadota bacterium]
MLDNWIPDASGWFPIEGANVLDFSDNALEVDLWCDHPDGGFRFCSAFHDGDGVWRDRFDKLEDRAPGSRPTHFRYIPGSPGEPCRADRLMVPKVMVDAAQDVLACIVDPTEEGAASLIATALMAASADNPQPLSTAARDVLAERARQMFKEGWTPAHDDTHDTGEMSRAAACYALAATKDNHMTSDACGQKPVTWPWDSEWWKPSDRRRDLVKAGALILAELERLDRSANRLLAGYANEAVAKKRDEGAA